MEKELSKNTLGTLTLTEDTVQSELIIRQTGRMLNLSPYLKMEKDCDGRGASMVPDLLQRSRSSLSLAPASGGSASVICLLPYFVFWFVGILPCFINKFTSSLFICLSWVGYCCGLRDGP